MWGQVVYVRLANPKAWKLPPEPRSDFIITSSNDYIPLDGYVLDIGNSPHSFYAKAHLDDSLDEMLVSDGRNVAQGAASSGGEPDPESYYRRVTLGQPVTLGDYDQGILLELISTQLSGTYSPLPGLRPARVSSRAWKMGPAKGACACPRRSTARDGGT